LFNLSHAVSPLNLIYTLHCATDYILNVV
jgi:hypothetical protein